MSSVSIRIGSNGIEINVTSNDTKNPLRINGVDVSSTQPSKNNVVSPTPPNNKNIINTLHTNESCEGREVVRSIGKNGHWFIENIGTIVDEVNTFLKINFITPEQFAGKCGLDKQTIEKIITYKTNKIRATTYEKIRDVLDLHNNKSMGRKKLKHIPKKSSDVLITFKQNNKLTIKRLAEKVGVKSTTIQRIIRDGKTMFTEPVVDKIEKFVSAQQHHLQKGTM